MHHTRPNQRFWNSTRGRIVALLRRASRTVNELADALHLTDNAVRAHLTTLERDGLVQTGGTRRGAAARKPNQTFDLTSDASEQLFPKAYAPVLEQLLAVIGERLPAAERDALLREVGHRIAAAELPSYVGCPREERIQRALALLGDLGGEAEARPATDGAVVRVEGRDCPLAAVITSGHPEACIVAETLLADLIGATVTECCEKGTVPPRCCFAIGSSPSAEQTETAP